MKKVLLYTDTPQIGGAELQILLLCKFFDKRSIEPIVVLSNYQHLDNWAKQLEKEGIRTIRLNVKHKHDPRHFTELRKIIKKEQIDILHLQLWNPASCRYAFFAATSSKVPIVVTEHDPFALSTFKNLFKKLALRRTSKIVTISQNNRKLLTDLYPKHREKILMIHNGIDLTWWNSQLLRFNHEDIKEIKKKVFHAHENTLIITAVGELHERKGHNDLIHAMLPIIKKYPNVKLAIIGQGKEKSNLQALIKRLDLRRHVALVGYQDLIPPLLASSDIFVLPSRREAFGFVKVEAMACGLPIVATKVGGVPEIVQHEKNGLLARAEDPESLSKAILRLIEDPDLRAQLAKAGKRSVEAHFSAKEMASQYQKLYQSLA